MKDRYQDCKLGDCDPTAFLFFIVHIFLPFFIPYFDSSIFLPIVQPSFNRGERFTPVKLR